MTTIQLHYRNFIPFGVIALPFVQTEVSGNDYQSVERDLREITKAIEEKSKIYMIQLYSDLEKICNKITKINDAIQTCRKNQKWYVLWTTKEEKELQNEREEFIFKQTEIQNNIDYQNHKQYRIDVNTKIYEIKKYLLNNNYCLRHEYQQNYKTVQIWEKIKGEEHE